MKKSWISGEVSRQPSVVERPVMTSWPSSIWARVKSSSPSGQLLPELKESLQVGLPSCDRGSPASRVAEASGVKLESGVTEGSGVKVAVGGAWVGSVVAVGLGPSGGACVSVGRVMAGGRGGRVPLTRVASSASGAGAGADGWSIAQAPKARAASVQAAIHLIS